VYNFDDPGQPLAINLPAGRTQGRHQQSLREEPVRRREGAAGERVPGRGQPAYGRSEGLGGRK
jgi:hypothetical protein